MAIRFVTKHEIERLYGLSAETQKRYRLSGKWTEGIHWIRVNSRVIRYNLPLIEDWFLNVNSPQLHNQAVTAYVTSLPCNRPKKRGRKSL